MANTHILPVHFIEYMPQMFPESLASYPGYLGAENLEPGYKANNLPYSHVHVIVTMYIVHVH